MTAVSSLGVLGALAASGAVLLLAHGVLGMRLAGGALVATLVAGAATVVPGIAFGIAEPSYLVGIALFALPVLLLLEAAAVAAGADRLARWLLLLCWGAVVFPLSALVPLAAVSACAGPECGFADFAGALPLFVSASAFLVLTWVSPIVPPELRSIPPRCLVAGLGLLVGGYLLWLVHMEGVLDQYVPRILAAGVAAPLAALVGWLVVDRLRGSGMTASRILAGGLSAGMVAIAPGAVSVLFPWTVIVGLLAGVGAAVMHSSRALLEAGEVARWALALLTAAALGFLAPPISGDAVGIVFSARIGALSAPILVFLGVSLLAMIASLPVWLLLRRRALPRSGRA